MRYINLHVCQIGKFIVISWTWNPNTAQSCNPEFGNGSGTQQSPAIQSYDVKVEFSTVLLSRVRT